jgi:hypothetical protein
MKFIVKIFVIDGRLQSVTFENMEQPVSIGAALQVIEATKAALLGVVIAQPEQPEQPPYGEAPSGAKQANMVVP